MAQFQKLALRRHRVSIAGRVLEGGTGRPLEGCELELTEIPDAFRRRLALLTLQQSGRSSAEARRPDRTRSTRDGSFFFLDLPSGDYVVTAALPAQGFRYGRTSLATAVSVAESDAQGLTTEEERRPRSEEEVPSPLPPLLELTLPPTTLRGLVQTQVSSELEPVYMARVRVKGSGEEATVGSDGQFSLYGIEPGARTVVISAQGYSPTPIAVQLNQGDVTQIEVVLAALSEI